MSHTIKLVQIQHGSKFLKPKLHKKAFYKIFAPIGFKLKPMESIILDLKFNIYSPELQGTDFNLFSTLQQFGLYIEENNWKTASKNETIKICILNKNYTHAFNIKKGQVIAYYLLPYTNKRICTDYDYNETFDDN